MAEGGGRGHVGAPLGAGRLASGGAWLWRRCEPSAMTTPRLQTHCRMASRRHRRARRRGCCGDRSRRVPRRLRCWDAPAPLGAPPWVPGGCGRGTPAPARALLGVVRPWPAAQPGAGGGRGPPGAVWGCPRPQGAVLGAEPNQSRVMARGSSQALAPSLALAQQTLVLALKLWHQQRVGPRGSRGCREQDTALPAGWLHSQGCSRCSSTSPGSGAGAAPALVARPRR